MIYKPLAKDKHITISTRLLFVFLVLACNPALANLWMPYWYDEELTNYYDPIWVKKNGNLVEFEVLTDLLAVQTTADYKQYLSYISVLEYDCIAETYTRKSVSNWSKPFAGGEQVGEMIGGFSQDIKILPRTMASELFAIICGRRLVQP